MSSEYTNSGLSSYIFLEILGRKPVGIPGIGIEGEVAENISDERLNNVKYLIIILDSSVKLLSHSDQSIKSEYSFKEPDTAANIILYRPTFDSVEYQAA